MFCPAPLAARIDRAEGRLCASIGRALAERQSELGSSVIEIGGGVAVYAGPGSPTNKMIGIGFDGPIADEELDRVEALFAGRSAPLQAEVSTLADPAVHAQLRARGYQPRGFENVLGHPLTTLQEPPAGIGVTISGEAELPELTNLVVAAWAVPDEGGVGGDAVPPSDELRRWFELTMRVPGFRGYVARLGSDRAGAGMIRFDAGIAQFSGAATLPQFRRRGVQTALLRARLADAAREGCDVGVVVTQPASKSQQNVQREGFALLYARQLWVKG